MRKLTYPQANLCESLRQGFAGRIAFRYNNCNISTLVRSLRLKCWGSAAFVFRAAPPPLEGRSDVAREPTVEVSGTDNRKIISTAWIDIALHHFSVSHFQLRYSKDHVR